MRELSQELRDAAPRREPAGDPPKEGAAGSRAGTAGTAPDSRGALRDLLGSFSEQTGAHFG